MIPDEAAEAAAEWLPHSGDCEVRPERDCTCWQPRVDLMRAALEAAAPHIAASIELLVLDPSKSTTPHCVEEYNAGLKNAILAIRVEA